MWQALCNVYACEGEGVPDFRQPVFDHKVVRAMKVNVELDLTPEEARRFMGLPDVEQANAMYVDALTSAMKGVSSVEQLEEYAKQLAPMGQMGLKVFQSFIEGATNQAASYAGGTTGSSGRKSGS